MPMNTLRKLARYISSSSSGVVGEVDAGLGREPQRVVVLFHPGMMSSQQLLGLLLVADEVVVDDERRVEAGLAHVVELGHELLGLLHPRLAAEDHDDVAELALERAAARELQRARRVAVDLEQVVARPRHLGHVGAARPARSASSTGRPRGEVVEELRPGGLGLADEHDVAQAVEERSSSTETYGAADDGEDASSRAGATRISRMRSFWTFMPVTPTMSYWRSDSQSISSTFSSSRATSCPRRSAGNRGQRAGDHRAALVARIERQRVLEAPVRRLEAGIDQADRQPAGWGRHRWRRFDDRLSGRMHSGFERCPQRSSLWQRMRRLLPCIYVRYLYHIGDGFLWGAPRDNAAVECDGKRIIVGRRRHGQASQRIPSQPQPATAWVDTRPGGHARSTSD